MARGGYQLGTAAAGDVANQAMETAKGNYLANFVLYPGGWVLQIWGLYGEHVYTLVLGDLVLYPGGRYLQCGGLFEEHVEAAAAL
jgi:predicted 2-oxoglutarate/Fe(II)-dependent dioxygenase YbiX